MHDSDLKSATKNNVLDEAHNVPVNKSNMTTNDTTASSMSTNSVTTNNTATNMETTNMTTNNVTASDNNKNPNEDRNNDNGNEVSVKSQMKTANGNVYQSIEPKVVVSFASIMAEQESEKRQRQQLREYQIEQKRKYKSASSSSPPSNGRALQVSFCEDVEGEEERMMRLAIEASLRESQSHSKDDTLQAPKRPHSVLKTSSSTSNDNGDDESLRSLSENVDENAGPSISSSSHVSFSNHIDVVPSGRILTSAAQEEEEDMDDDIRRAIALSLQDFAGDQMESNSTAGDAMKIGAGDSAAGQDRHFLDDQIVPSPTLPKNRTQTEENDEESEDDRKPSALTKNDGAADDLANNFSAGHADNLTDNLANGVDSIDANGITSDVNGGMMEYEEDLCLTAKASLHASSSSSCSTLTKTPATSAAAAAKTVTTCTSPKLSQHDESEKLAHALHRAELAEYSASQSAQAASDAASIQLALQLQREEDSRAASWKRAGMCTGGNGNGGEGYNNSVVGVRTVCAEEFREYQRLKTGNDHDGTLNRRGGGRGWMSERQKEEERGVGKLLLGRRYQEDGDESMDDVDAGCGTAGKMTFKPISDDSDYDGYYYHEDSYQDHETMQMDHDCHEDDDDGIQMNPQSRSSNTKGKWTRLNKHSFIGPNDEIRTKHDPELQHRSNAIKLLGSHGAKLQDVSTNSRMNYPKNHTSSFNSNKDNDKTYSSASVSNCAYNAFRRAEARQSGMKKGVAKHGRGRAENMNASKTRGGAMDGSVRLQIAAAIGSGLIDKCNGVVKEGKEALVYHADGGKEKKIDLIGATMQDKQGPTSSDSSSLHPTKTASDPTKEMTDDYDHNNITRSEGYDVAVKVFKRISEFKGRGAYVDGDPRYHRQKFNKTDQRERVTMWAEKEYRNLIRANRAGVAVPKPLSQKENILFMRFLGEDGWPSPQLKEIGIRKGSDRWITLYCQTLVAVRRLYHCARLIHADLSEYNILICPTWQTSQDRYHTPNERTKDDESLQVVLIDFGQAVELGHPAATELLRRDLSTIREFFVRQGIKALTNADAEEFVLAPLHQQESCNSSRDDGKKLEPIAEATADATNENEPLEQGEGKRNDLSTGSITIDGASKEKNWRHAIPGWDDTIYMEILLAKLKDIH